MVSSAGAEHGQPDVGALALDSGSTCAVGRPELAQQSRLRPEIASLRNELVRL